MGACVSKTELDVMCELNVTNRELLRVNMDLHKRDRSRFDPTLVARVAAANESMRVTALELVVARTEHLRALGGKAPQTPLTPRRAPWGGEAPLGCFAPQTLLKVGRSASCTFGGRRPPNPTQCQWGLS
jgi:hypothetical protein